jgi:hypothetical protein
LQDSHQQMIDFNLYRVAFAPALVAVIVLAFSLEGVPEPIPSGLAPAVFESTGAVPIARQIAKDTPDRRPGSDGDEQAAEVVRKSFEDLSGGTVSEQTYDSSYAGDDVSLRNVLLTLPGTSPSTIAVVAARDSAIQPGAVSSAAATGVLIELARALSATDHTETIVLVSTDGGADGASGARTFLDDYADRDSIEATLVISQPGAADRSQPYLVTSSAGDSSAPIQLAETAARDIETAVGKGPDRQGAFTQLARLAFPDGLGEQAVLIDGGMDAVAISSAGENPLPASRDGEDDVSSDSISEFGRAALSTVLALDASSQQLDHGPDSYVRIGNNLVPGSSLALLALALLLPAGVAAIDALTRAARNGLSVVGSLIWVAAIAAPPLAALVFLYLLALVGLIPRPAFPFDPALFDLGRSETLAIAVLLGLAGAGYWFLGLLRPRRRTTPEARTASAGLVIFVAALLAWLVNPFLALFAVLLAHCWIPVARFATGPGAAAAIVAVATVPLVAAALTSAGAIGLGVWDIVVMIAGGQIGPFTCVALILGGAGTLGLILGSIRSPQTPRASRVRPSDA